jgi:hypothetical protein
MKARLLDEAVHWIGLQGMPIAGWKACGFVDDTKRTALHWGLVAAKIIDKSFRPLRQIEARRSNAQTGS